MAKRILTTKEIEFNTLLLAGKTIRDASEKVGIEYNTAKHLATHPAMVRWRDKTSKKAQSLSVKNLALTKNDILAKYWALACLPPCQENGAVITRACDSIRDTLGWSARFDVEKKGEGDKPADPDVYQPAWMNSVQ